MKTKAEWIQENEVLHLQVSTLQARVERLESISTFLTQVSKTESSKYSSTWEYWTGPGGRLVDVSLMCQLLTGYSREELLEDPRLLVEIVYSEDRARFLEHARVEPDLGSPALLKFRMQNREGEISTVSHECIPQFDPDGALCGHKVVNWVVSTHDWSPEVFFTSPEIWRYLIENAPDIITIVDENRRIIFTNSRPAGSPTGTSIDKLVESFILPAQRELAVGKINKVLQTGEADYYEIASDHIPGKIKWYMTHLGPIHHEGKIVAVMLMIRDITERKESEQALSRLNEELENRVAERTRALQESTERQRVIAELIPDYIYSARHDPRDAISLEWISGAFDRITGYTQQEVNACPRGWLDIVHPEDQSAWQEVSHLEPGPKVRDYRILTKSGEIRWIRDHSQRVESTDGSDLPRVLGAAQDITAQVQAEDALQQYARRLEASLQLSTALRQAEHRQEALDTLVRHSLQTLDADVGGVYQVQKEELVFAAGVGLSALPPLALPMRNNNLLYLAMRKDRITYHSTIGNPQPDCEFCLFLHREGMQSVVVIPLRTSEASVGVLYIGYRRLTHLSPHDKQLLGAFAEAGGNTLQRLQVMDQIKQNISNRERELKVLYEITSFANETPELEKLLEKSLATVLQAIDCPAGLIHLLDPADHQLKITVRAGFPEASQTGLDLVLKQERLWESAFERQGMVSTSRLRNESESAAPEGPTEPDAYLGAPILAKGTAIGVLSLFGGAWHLLTPTTKQLIGAVSDQLGLAVESARLRKKAEEAVVLQERQRMARELHDSVSQSLYALVISADVGNKLLRLRDYLGLRQELSDIGKVALQALKEMRLMLFELRPSSLETEGLVGALELRLNTVERRAGIDSTLDVKGALHLPPGLEQEIYRVTIEALNNSLKHAGASSISIGLEVRDGQFSLVVADNGCGFDPAQGFTDGGIGLTSMRERARSLGGRLEVTSTPGQGSCIQFDVPLAVQNSSLEGNS
jgi:PAS domain S-box-containing protein